MLCNTGWDSGVVSRNRTAFALGPGGVVTGIDINLIQSMRAVEAKLLYVAPASAKPRIYTYDPPPGIPRTSTVDELHTVAIRDVRPIVSTVSLDREGLAVVQHRSSVRDFYDEDEICRAYYPEVERLLKDVTGGDRVLAFNHAVRRRGTADRARQPIARVHVDYTEKSGPEIVTAWLPDEAAELLRGRVQIINLWRPIRGPLRDFPLAVCDARSVDAEDLVPSDIVYRDRTDELYWVTYNPAHRWFYVPEMRTDEAILIKCYDSQTDGRARFAPHAAFVDRTAPPDAPPRESIEVRALVFHRFRRDRAKPAGNRHD